MTRTGCVCMIVLMAAALLGLILCATRQRKAGKPRPAAGERETVTGEPVIFRTAELRFANCKASMELSKNGIEARGFSLDKDGLASAGRYMRKELAYLLADQALEAGAIRFEVRDGTIRAELRAVIPEGSST